MANLDDDGEWIVGDVSRLDEALGVLAPDERLVLDAERGLLVDEGSLGRAAPAAQAAGRRWR